MTRFRSVAIFAVSVSLAWSAPAQADAVTDWNATTLLYVGGGPGTPPSPPVGRGGPPGLLDIAIVHLAIHDAVQAVEGRYQPYVYSDPSRFGLGSSAAAEAAAAHRMLVLLYPSQTGPLDTLYNNYLTTHGLVGDPGLAHR